MKRCFTLFLAVLVLLVLVMGTGCVGKQKEAVEPIKIGAIFSVTGGAAKLGGPEKNAALMIIDSINIKGGIKGRPVELIIEDDQSVEENTQNAAQKLIFKDNVVAIIGPTASGNAYAAAAICEEAKIPMVSCAAAFVQLFPDQDTAKPMYKYVYKTPQNDSDCAKVILEDCVKKGFTKIAIVTSSNGFGAAGRAELVKDAPAFGVTILADETYPPDASDLTPILTKIKAQNPQAIINWSVVDAQRLIASQMKQIGLGCQLYQSHGFGNTQYITPEAEGVLFPAGRLLVINDIPESDVQYSVLKNFSQDYRARWSEDVSTFAGHAYDALNLIAQAVTRGEATREGIRQELENSPANEFVGTAGVFKMTPSDHCGLDKNAFVLVTVKGGVFRLASAVQ